jgi:hypothetical protein
MGTTIVVPMDQSPVSQSVFSAGCRAVPSGGTLLIVVPPGRMLVQVTAEAEAISRGIDAHSYELESDRAAELIELVRDLMPVPTVVLSPETFDYAGWLSLITAALVRARPCPFLVPQPSS